MSVGPDFFVVGAGRSGTTLLRLMLAGHSRLHIPPETWFIEPLVEQLPLTAPLKPAQLDAALRIMTGHERWPDMDFPADALRCQALAMAAPTLGSVIALVYARQAELSGKQRVGGKTPHYLAILPQLATLFPAARFIHLIRDGRDVAISWIDAGWNRYHQRGFEWRAAMRWREFYQTSPWHDRVLEVRYEALVREPEATLRTICSFLGEVFEPGMLDWQPRLALVPERDRHLHGKLGRGLLREATSVWRHRLARWECLAIEACLGPELRAAGYVPRHQAVFWRPVLSVAGAVLHTASPLLSYAIPRLQRRGLLPRRMYL